MSKKIDLATAIDHFKLIKEFSVGYKITKHIKIEGKTFNTGTPSENLTKYLHKLCEDFDGTGLCMWEDVRMSEFVERRVVEDFPIQIKKCFLGTEFEGYHVFSWESGNILTQREVSNKLGKARIPTPFTQIPTYEQLQTWAWTGMVNNNI